MIGIAARIRRSLHASGILAGKRLPRPVISVGNLTVGGAGKTPHVIFLAGWFFSKGLRVAVLSRGYGRSTSGVRWVSDGKELRSDWREAGDEPFLMARRLQGIPVLVGESRFDAGMECLSKREIDVFLLDDGFQHLSLRRDVDLLLVDAARGLGNRMTLPFGPLREPPGHARFADALIVTKCMDAAGGERVASTVPFPPGRPRALTRMFPSRLLTRDGIPVKLPPPGTPVVAFSGLAQNGSFRDTLRDAGFDVVRFVGFRDHCPYGEMEIRRIEKMAGGLKAITTEKDLVRLPADIPFEVLSLEVGIEFISGFESISEMIAGCINVHSGGSGKRS